MDRESVLYEQLSMIDQVLSSGVDSYSTVYPELIGFLEDWLRTNSQSNTHPIRSVPLQESGAESIGHGANAPCPIRSPLLKHQTQMVLGMMAHCIRMQRGFVWQEQILRGKLGVLGDPPGSGKTLTILAFLAAQAGMRAAEAALDRGWATVQGITNRDVSGAGGAGAGAAAIAEPQYRMGELDVHSNRYVFSNDIEPVSDLSACNLVVVPPTLLGHWRHEVALHTTFQPFVVDGRRVLRNRTTAAQMAASPFVLCTSKTYRYVLEYAEAQGIRWKHVFMDDAAGIVLTNNDTLPVFEFLWLIAGNWLPFVLRNVHLHPVNLQYVRPRITLSVEGERWLADMLATERTVQPSLASSAFFRGVIPFSHRGRAALVLRNSSASLNASINTTVSWEQGQTERVIQCMPTVTMAQLTPAFLAARGDSLTGQIPLLFQALGLHTLSVHELQMHHRERQALLDRKLCNDCSICLEAPQNRTVLTCCMTPYCGACILRHTVSHPYGHSVCPSCRTPIYVPSIVHVPANVSTDASNSAIDSVSHTPFRSLTKQEALVEAIVSAPQGSSHLVYSQFENTFYQVQPLLAQRGIVAEQLTMPMSRYQNTLRGYQDGRIHVLFVNDTSLIRGQNLQRSTHLVLFCEPAFYDTQQNLAHAVQRLGRTVPLTLLRLSSAL